MKMTILAVLAAALFGATASNASAQTNSETPRKVFARTNTVTAKVAKIDYDKRELTLKTADGRTRKFTVGEDVERFPQIKKGDDVKMTYYESMALALAKPGSALPPTGRHAALLSRAPGEKPGGTAVSVVDLTATVEDVDRDRREVTLRGPEGNSVVVEVDPEVGNLEQIHKGDQIAITATEAMAVSVEKP
jgi:hypothetical protein